MTPLSQALARDGHVWLRSALPEAEIQKLRSQVEAGQKPGTRLEPTSDLTQAILRASATAAIATLAPGMRPVRIMAFDKSGDNNWSLPWHQDRVIAVTERVDLRGFGNWSKKGSFWHCEPPEALLHRMLFTRIHLDPTDPETGAMQFAPGTHQLGQVASAEAASMAEKSPCQTECAAAGDMLVLPMLTLHRSMPAKGTAPRRVLRIDFADTDLPAPLTWALQPH